MRSSHARPTARIAFAMLIGLGGYLAAGCSKNPAAQSNPFATPTPAATSAMEASSGALPGSAAAAAQTTGTTLTPGADYVAIPNGHRFDSRDERIEVVEVFGYVCPACAQFHPLIDAWSRRLPKDVKLIYVPAPYGPEWIPYARGFYAADSLGLVGATHGALIDAIHIRHTMPGEGEPPSEERIAHFYAEYGTDEKEFLSRMRSFAVDTRIAKGKQFMLRSGVEGTPTLIVNGKYRVLGRSFEDALRIADALIRTERTVITHRTNAASRAP
jgi:thiol:disulfide interchange protein DsbA